MLFPDAFFTGLCGFRFAEERRTFTDMWTSLDTFSWKAVCAQKCLRQQFWAFFYTSLWRARTVGPVFPAVLFPVAFLDFLCTDRQVSSRKRDRACWSSELYLGFVSAKEKLVCSYKTIHGEKVKSEQKTLCTCHRISGYGALERRQEVARFCGWFRDGAAGDFAANGGGLFHHRREFVCSCRSCIHCQLFFARVLSARGSCEIRRRSSIVSSKSVYR